MPKADPKANRKNVQEDIAYLRQQCGSLTMRGRYPECAKLIEDNLALVYTSERWPESFFAFLKPYQRCYPALNHSESLEEHVEKLLEKQDIPKVFARFFKEPPTSWSRDYFQKKAVDAKAAGRAGEALAWCDLAIKADGASSNLYLLKGWILEDLERGSDAVKAFQQSLELNAANYKASQGIARQYAQTNLKKAMEFIEEGIAAYPDEPGFLAEKATVLLKMNRPDDAMACYDKAAELDPYNPEFVYRKAELLLSQDKEMAAIPQYKRAIALNSKHVPSLLRMAALMEAKQPSAALDYVTTAAGQEPGDREALLLRARLLSRTGDNGGAIKQYAALLELDPAHIDALSGIAGCYLKEDAARALEAYGKAAALEPNNAAHHMGKAKALELLRRNPQAAEEYKAVISLDKRSGKAYFRLAMLLSESEQAAALSHLDKAVAIAPETAEYHAERGLLLRAMGREKEAADSLNLACQHDPGNAVYHCELGVLLSRAGNRASAVKNLQEAVSLSPSMAAAHRLLAELLLYSEPENALDHINAAIGLELANPSHYFLKSRIISRFKDDARALAVMRTRLEAMEDASGEEAYDEVGRLIRGESLQVAMVHLARAIELDPRNTSYLCERAHLLYRQGKQGKAREQYEELLRKDSRNHEALFGLGRILASQKDLKALERFDKAIALSPSTAEYHAAKAEFLSRDPDKYQEAVACYDTAIPLDTWNYEPILQKARLLDSHGDRFPAIAGYRRVLLVNPKCVEATTRLGELLCDLRPDAAYHYIAHAESLNPGDWRLTVRKARILMAREKTEEAAAVCSQALEMASASPGANYEIARAFADQYPAYALQFAREAAEREGDNGAYQYLCGELCLVLDDLDGAQKRFEAAASLGYKEGGAKEKAVELLYRQGLPRALEAAGTLPETAEGVILKARIYDELADPPRTAEAVELLAAAVKKLPDELPLREVYVEFLRKRRSLLRVPIENAKLEALRRKLKKERDDIVHVKEITFESEQEEAANQPEIEIGGYKIEAAGDEKAEEADKTVQTLQE